MYYFEPPVFEENPISNHRLFMRLKIQRSLTVLKIGNEYYEVQYPSQDELAMASVYYQGGRRYQVSDEEANDLINAGYVVMVL